MRVESKLEDMYINDLIRVHKYLTSRKNEMMTSHGPKPDKEELYRDYTKEVDYLESVIFDQYKHLSKNSKSYNSSEPQQFFIP